MKRNDSLLRAGARILPGLFFLGLLLPVAALAQDHATAGVAPQFPGSFAVQLLMRWTHVLTAVVVVGGTAFMRLVLVPAASSTLDDPTHSELRRAILGKWRKVVHAGIVLFLISGLYNYLMVTRFNHQDSAYHMFFGIKFLLGLAVFVLAILLTSSKGYAERFRANNGFWTGILLVLAFIVIMMGGYMKALH